jgi:predicted ATPase/DNA-binding SARP family transcriptional activator
VLSIRGKRHENVTVRTAEIRVLGPLEIVRDDASIAPLAPKERRLLGALLLEPGSARSNDVLVDALWGSSPPPSAAKLLQVYVSKLRKTLPASARIRTKESGYSLEVEEGAIDAARFDRLVAEGRDAARAGNHALAAAIFERALELWRGDAYGDLAYEEFARAEAERLEELRLVALEERIEARLELGRHAELLAELLSLANANPLRERLQAQAMLALYRAGRQAEALDRYAATRRRLRDQLGLEPSSELRHLQRRILQHDPMLAGEAEARETGPTSLPTPPTSLLGRERELAELGDLLRRDDVRLLVLTGAGGSGKTRLALEAARRSALSFANGAAVVELAPVRDPDLLLGAIATALGIEPIGEPPLETLAAALRQREMLVLLDNLEHLRLGASALVDLLSRAPRLTLLVTSRVVLHVSGEHVYPVEPLREQAAVELFLQRAREADARFDPDEKERIRRVCERLDRLPLAIELAAGAVRTLTVDEIDGRLEARLPLLVGGPRDLPARQQTLRATLEWSIDLLDDDERRQLARLSVFAGGCTLEAAEAVCGTSLERLSSLVDHNLLLRTVGGHGSRYSMLETIREFAAELLEASGEVDELRRRHAEWALLVAESLGLSFDELGSGVPQRHDAATAEQENMRFALDWALEMQPELGLRIVLALEQFWAKSPHEGMKRLAALFARAGDIPLKLRARALRDLGGLTEVSGDLERATVFYEQSLALYETLGDEAGIIRLRHRLSHAPVARGELAAARKLVEETLARARAGGFRYEETELLSMLGHIESRAGNAEAALAHQLASLELLRALGTWAWGEAIALINLAECSTTLGRLEDAETYALEGLELSRTIGDRINTVFSLAALACAARAGRADERAGRLWGAIEAEEDRASLGWWAADRERYASKILVPATAELEQGLVAGRRMTLEEAVAHALRLEETVEEAPFNA